MLELMLPGGNRTICMTWHMMPGLDLRSMRTDPARHLLVADTVDGLNHELSKL